MVTLNYGTGSPQEGAAMLAYLNGSTTNTTNIGFGQQWDDTTSTWVQKDWKTAGYWASLRAAAPLAVNDGLNFLRLGRSAPFSLHYYEIGNEVYGSWETDHHGAGGDTGLAHDATTYVRFAKAFSTYAQLIDPSISIGVDSGGVDTWITNVLTQSVAQSFLPGWISDHNYMMGPGTETDAKLLLQTISDTTNGLSWVKRATGYRTLLQQKLGANAASVELLATEFNSVYSGPGKQTTSIVNGLFAADAIANLLITEYNGGWTWDLRNGWDTANNNSASLYGWHKAEITACWAAAAPPRHGTYIPYPTYFSEQLLSKMVHDGDVVVRATSNDTYLPTYAIRQKNGHLSLLVINKHATNNLTGNFTLTGYTPTTQATIWQYGKAEDTAQSLTTDGHASLSSFGANLSLNGSSFSYVFPSYSMTVMDLRQRRCRPAGRMRISGHRRSRASRARMARPGLCRARARTSGMPPTSSTSPARE